MKKQIKKIWKKIKLFFKPVKFYYRGQIDLRDSKIIGGAILVDGKSLARFRGCYFKDVKVHINPNDLPETEMFLDCFFENCDVDQDIHALSNRCRFLNKSKDKPEVV